MPSDLDDAKISVMIPFMQISNSQLLQAKVETADGVERRHDGSFGPRFATGPGSGVTRGKF